MRSQNWTALYILIALCPIGTGLSVESRFSLVFRKDVSVLRMRDAVRQQLYIYIIALCPQRNWRVWLESQALAWLYIRYLHEIAKDEIGNSDASKGKI